MSPKQIPFRSVKISDINKQRQKYKARLEDIETNKAELIFNGGGDCPEKDALLEKMSTARWEVEQGLRALDIMESKKEEKALNRGEKRGEDDSFASDDDEEDREDEESSDSEEDEQDGSKKETSPENAR